MKVITVIDSFKGSLSSVEAGLAASEGIKKVYPDATVTVRPLADGGEGTVDALIEGFKGEYRYVTVKDPLGRDVTASYGVINGDTAVIEMAAAAGITLITQEERDPMKTTTYGVGQIILDAMNAGCRKFIVGIGGSATNDGGIGMLKALGFGMYDENGNEVENGAKGLKELAKIDLGTASPILAECEFNIACDVTNPLCGENGCSAIYGPQKGATPEMIREMDAYLEKYAELTKSVIPDADKNYPGCGAAGGIGFAFREYLGGTLKSGISLILDATDAEKFIKDADIVITGEGRLDGQTAMGKAPVGVARLAKKHGKTVIAFSGCVTDDASECNGEGIDAFFPILDTVRPLSEALDKETAHKNLSRTAEQVFRLIKACRK